MRVMQMKSHKKIPLSAGCVGSRSDLARQIPGALRPILGHSLSVVNDERKKKL
jgi:hypothetical protein